MKLSIYPKGSDAPVLILSQDDMGMKVIGGDARMVQALKLNQFNDLKEIADFLNQDPSQAYQAIGEEEQQEEPSLDDKISPAIKILKELMGKVSQQREAEKADEAADKPEARAERTMGVEVTHVPGEMFYVSYDGDNIGNAVARAEETDDEQQLQAMSARINAGQQIAQQWAQQVGGQIVEAGGDEGLIKVPGTAIERIEDLRTQYQSVVGATLTVGVGKKISESTKARMLGKLKGKNRVEMFDETTPKELALRMEGDEDESKKIRTAMTGEPGMPQEVSNGPLQEGSGNDRGQAQQDRGEEVPATPEGKAPEATEESEPGMDAPRSEAGEEFTGISPELLRAASQMMKKKEEPTESVLANAYNDPEIENADYSYSDDPEFSKALRYAAKHGG